MSQSPSQFDVSSFTDYVSRVLCCWGSAIQLNLPKSCTRQLTLLVLYFVTGILDSNEESNSKYPVLPNWGFIHDFTELLAGEVAGAGEAGGGGDLSHCLDAKQEKLVSEGV